MKIIRRVKEYGVIFLVLICFCDSTTVLSSYCDNYILTRDISKIYVITKMAAEREHIVKLKGFSFDVSKKDIKDFYMELDIKEKDINLLRYPDGRSTGYAFIRLKSSNEVDLALLQDNRYMGNRYVSVTRSSLEEMTMIQSLVDQKKPIYVLRSAESSFARSVRDRSPINYDSSTPPMLNISEETNVVFVMGIPERKGYKEVRRFFSGCHIQPGGVYLCCGTSDRHNGTAYVEFVNEEECAKAKGRDGCQMGDNFITVTMCSREEMLDYLEKYPKTDTKNNWAGTSSRDEDERKVYHSRSERRVHRNEEDNQTYSKTDYQDDNLWWSGDDKIIKESHQEAEDDSSRHRSKHRHHHSKSRGGESNYNGGSYHGSNGERRVRRGSRHRSADMDENLQGDAMYSRKHYRSDSYHRSSHHRDDNLMEGSTSYLDTQPGTWDKLDTSLGSSTGDAEIDPLLALELLKTAAITQGTLDTKRGGLPVPSSSTLYNSRSSGRSYKGLDQPPPPSITGGHYSPASKGIVLMEGLPYETTVSDILDFFHNYNLTFENIRIQCRDDGSPSGKAFVSFLDNDTAKLAVRHLNKGYVGGRYVELKVV